MPSGVSVRVTPGTAPPLATILSTNGPAATVKAWNTPTVKPASVALLKARCHRQVFDIQSKALGRGQSVGPGCCDDEGLALRPGRLRELSHTVGEGFEKWRLLPRRSWRSRWE